MALAALTFKHANLTFFPANDFINFREQEEEHLQNTSTKDDSTSLAFSYNATSSSMPSKSINLLIKLVFARAMYGLSYFEGNVSALNVTNSRELYLQLNVCYYYTEMDFPLIFVCDRIKNRLTSQKFL